MEPTRQKGSEPSINRRFQLRFLIVAAAIWHVSLAIAVFSVGRYQLFPSQIHPTGIGTSDGIVYQDQIPELCRILKNEGLVEWATWPNQLHVRLYSLPAAVVSRWFAFNILTIEPLNLLYYLAILILVFKLAEAIFDYRSGLIAAVIVGLWPSFLVHTTQLLRDPLLILAVLVLVWSLIESLRHELSWRRTLLLGLATIASIVSIRIVRLPMWYVIVAAVGASVVLLVIRAIQTKRVNKYTVAYAVLIVAAVAIMPSLQPFFHNQQESGAPRLIRHEDLQELPLQEQLVRHRDAFRWRLDVGGEARAAEDGSRIDADVSFHSAGDIIRQVPRAVIIGFFAPFPNMWFRPGKQVGYGGRIISGFETLLTYVIESMALFGLWSVRKKLSAWLLVIVIGLGTVALGLVVNNIGAMYRLRYPFWVLIVILGAGGLSLSYRRTISKFKIQRA